MFPFIGMLVIVGYFMGISWEYAGKYGIDPNGDLTHDPRVSVTPPIIRLH